MKKALGILAIAGAATAAVVYKLKKDNKDNSVEELETKVDEVQEEVELTEEEIEESFEDVPAMETTSYPNLNRDEIVRLNEICEEAFEAYKVDEMEKQERPLQHIVTFENEADMEEYKTVVIKEGYVVANGKDGELIVLNITATDLDKILAKVFQLADLAKKYNGSYIRWVIK